MVHPTTSIGLFLIYGVVLLPVYVMFAGWLFGGPRNYRAVGITFGYMLGFMGLVVGGLFVLDTVITLVTLVT